VINAILISIPIIGSKVKEIKNGESINFDKFSALVTSTDESSNFLEELKRIVSF